MNNPLFVSAITRKDPISSKYIAYIPQIHEKPYLFSTMERDIIDQNRNKEELK